MRPSLQHNRWFKGCLLLLPTVLLLYLLVQLFPYTSLLRLIMFPLIVAINAGVIFIVAKKSEKKVSHMVKGRVRNTLIIVLTLLVTIVLYPQASDRHIVVQIKDGIHAIRHYEDITPKDLKLNKDQSGRIIGDSNHIYEKAGNRTFDLVIINVEQIPEKLMGFHKLMWWIMEHH
ncbi:hypothetical protein JNUCC31_23580 [Paenibacillus sp. JNUCC31]|uniref:hypothetical protein n=1 Tax=Paenibacillus sp. JNUCC-31 TaxID=2777983 RepID=UPI0017837383|nr:hypothetical protein [Paenibacillus sp. JNUCC-31]QOS77715.1 hypothetical protein JNUCC31_23580 [Paenibacillus sp. JNUCC-31]